MPNKNTSLFKIFFLLAFVIGVLWLRFQFLSGEFKKASSDSAAEEFFPALQGIKWGYINSSGEMKIRPQYENAQPFFEGLAAVCQNGKWGYVNKLGEVKIQFLFRSAQRFIGGTAVVDSGLPQNSMGVIDSSGTWLSPPSFRSLQAGDKEGKFFIGEKNTGDHSYFYSPTGEQLFGPFEMAFPFSDGRARVKEGRDEEIIDQKGDSVKTEPVFFERIRFSDGLMAVRKDKKVGYINTDGLLVIPAHYDEGGDFKEGVAPVSLDGHWMFIDRTGAVAAILPGTVRYAESVSDGYALVSAERPQPGRKFGYVDLKGQWAIPAQWDEAEPFHHGLAAVGLWKDQTMLYIDRSGRIIWKQRLIDLGEFGSKVNTW